MKTKLRAAGRKLLSALTAPEVVALEKQLAIKIAIKLVGSAAAGAALAELFGRLA